MKGGGWEADNQREVPGGQVNLLPASRCRWIWETVCPASYPSLITILQPLSSFSDLAIWEAASRSFPRTASWCSWALESPVSPSLCLGMMRMWTGATGAMSRKAKTCSSSQTMLDGICLWMSLSKMVYSAMQDIFIQIVQTSDLIYGIPKPPERYGRGESQGMGGLARKATYDRLSPVRTLYRYGHHNHAYCIEADHALALTSAEQSTLTFSADMAPPDLYPLVCAFLQNSKSKVGVPWGQSSPAGTTVLPKFSLPRWSTSRATSLVHSYLARMLSLSAKPFWLGAEIAAFLVDIFLVLKSKESPAVRQWSLAFLIWKYEDLSLDTPVISATKAPLLPQTVPTPSLQYRQAYQSIPTPIVWLS